MNTPGTVYKLHDTADPLGPLGLMLRDASPQINRGKMSCRVKISRETPDRSGDTVRARGAVLDEHQPNPVVCVAHSRTVVCGMAEDPLGGYTVKMAPDGLGWDAETFFSQHTEIGEQAFRLVETKVFRGASIGFLPVAGFVAKSHHGGTDYQRWRLVEYSHLPLPDHPDCLVTAVEKGFGGKMLCAPLLDILKPLVPERPVVVVGGYEAVDKGVGTYKTAEPKEAVAQRRPHTFYTCPHCNAEMTHEGIFKDDDGTTRHGACRGAVVLKEPEHVLEAVDRPVGLTGIKSLADKSLANVITSRLGALRRKAMKPQDTDDEFLPVDDPSGDLNADPNAATDPNAADPHADHKAVVDDAVGNVLASIYDKFTTGQVDLKAAVKLFKECLSHHGNVASLGGGEDDPDAELDLDDEADPDDLDEEDKGDDADSVDDDDADDADDDSAAPAKKPFPKKYLQYTPQMRDWITKGYRLANTLAAKLERAETIDRDKLARVCDELLTAAMELEPVEKAIDAGLLVTKAKAKAKPAPTPGPLDDISQADLDAALLQLAGGS